MVRTTATVASDASFTERDDVRVVLGTANLPAAGVPEGQEDGRAARVAAAKPEMMNSRRSAEQQRQAQMEDGKETCTIPRTSSLA